MTVAGPLLLVKVPPVSSITTPSGGAALAKLGGGAAATAGLAAGPLARPASTPTPSSLDPTTFPEEETRTPPAPLEEGKCQCLSYFVRTKTVNTAISNGQTYIKYHWITVNYGPIFSITPVIEAKTASVKILHAECSLGAIVGTKETVRVTRPYNENNGDISVTVEEIKEADPSAECLEYEPEPFEDPITPHTPTAPTTPPVSGTPTTPTTSTPTIAEPTTPTKPTFPDPTLTPDPSVTPSVSPTGDPHDPSSDPPITPSTSEPSTPPSTDPPITSEPSARSDPPSPTPDPDPTPTGTPDPTTSDPPITDPDPSTDPDPTSDPDPSPTTVDPTPTPDPDPTPIPDPTPDPTSGLVPSTSLLTPTIPFVRPSGTPVTPTIKSPDPTPSTDPTTESSPSPCNPKTGGSGCRTRASDAAEANSGKLDALGSKLDAVIAANQAQILSRLGPQITGGLSGGLGRLFESNAVDRLLNLWGTALSLHNAIMLSNNLAQTIGSTIDAVMELTPFKFKDVEGSEISFTSLLGSTIEAIIRSVVGDEVYDNTSKTWNKANRIYQAATNMVDAMRSLFDTAQELAELTVANVAKIGNALKASGEILDDAYDWMSEKVTAENRVTRGLNRYVEGIGEIEEVFNSVEEIASSILEVTEVANEIKDTRDELQSSIDTFKEEKTTEATESTTASESPGIETEDFNSNSPLP